MEYLIIKIVEKVISQQAVDQHSLPFKVFTQSTSAQPRVQEASNCI